MGVGFSIILNFYFMFLLTTHAIATVAWIHLQNSTSVAEDAEKARNQTMKYRQRTTHYNLGGQQKENSLVFYSSPHGAPLLALEIP